MDAENIKILLLNQLKDYGAFWSYSDIGENIPDESLIENTLIYLDLEQINLLFEIFPKEYIKKIWSDNILVQEPRYHNLNKFLSWFYFNS